MKLPASTVTVLQNGLNHLFLRTHPDKVSQIPSLHEAAALLFKLLNEWRDHNMLTYSAALERTVYAPVAMESEVAARLTPSTSPASANQLAGEKCSRRGDSWSAPATDGNSLWIHGCEKHILQRVWRDACRRGSGTSPHALGQTVAMNLSQQPLAEHGRRNPHSWQPPADTYQGTPRTP